MTVGIPDHELELSTSFNLVDAEAVFYNTETAAVIRMAVPVLNIVEGRSWASSPEWRGDRLIYRFDFATPGDAPDQLSATESHVRITGKLSNGSLVSIEGLGFPWFEVSSVLQFSPKVGFENSLIGIPFGSFRRG